jgi:hypothetical protein
MAAELEKIEPAQVLGLAAVAAALFLLLRGQPAGPYKQCIVNGRAVPCDPANPMGAPPIPGVPGSVAIPGFGCDSQGNVLWVLDAVNLGPRTVPWAQVPAAWKAQFAQFVQCRPAGPPAPSPPTVYPPGPQGVLCNADGSVANVWDPVNLGPNSVPWSQIPAGWKAQYGNLALAQCRPAQATATQAVSPMPPYTAPVVPIQPSPPASAPPPSSYTPPGYLPPVGYVQPNPVTGCPPSLPVCLPRIG